MKNEKQLTVSKTRRTLGKDENGGTDFVETLILVALVAIAGIVAVTQFGGAISEKFGQEAGAVGALPVGGGAAQ